MCVLWSVPEITQATCLLEIYTEGGRILGRNPDKSLESCPHFYSKSPRQIFLEISISSNSRSLLQLLVLHCVTVHCKGERGRNPYRKLKSDNSQDYAQKPQRNCTLMNSASEQAFVNFRACA